MEYDHKKIEEKWRKIWQEIGLYKTPIENPKNPFYNLMMFPYPSAEGLHVGGVYAFSGVDTYGRFMRMKGHDVFEPFGLDGFGIHSENYAIKIGEHIRDVSKRTEKHFYEQVDMVGLGIDKSRLVETYKPNYYKWTQWLFLKMWEKGLSYRKKALVNYCPSCKTVLSDEQVENGKCERCKTEVEKKEQEQWFWKITDYAERLLQNLSWINWPEDVKLGQKNWIGKSEGSEVDFLVPKFEKKVYIATSNNSKLERFKKIFKWISPEIIVEKVPDFVEVDETEDSLEKNSTKKVLPYKRKTDAPIISVDTGIFIEGENINSVIPKRNVIGEISEKDLSEEETAKMMQDFYTGIAKKHGGSVDLELIDVFTVLFPNGEMKQEKSVREYVLHDKPKSKLDPYFPLRSIYTSKKTGKSADESSEEDEEIELLPQIESLRNLLFDRISVFTTRIDTIFSGTFLVLAPENPIVEKITKKENLKEVLDYKEKTKKKSELERTAFDREKTGVFTGSFAINPASKEFVPIWIADFVLPQYGTGAVFGDAHDERDFAFAKKYGIRLKTSIKPSDESMDFEKIKNLEECFHGEGVLFDSGIFNGLDSKLAREKITEWLAEKNLARKKTTYKLRDWCISRQRYWGPPIPMIYCKNCADSLISIIDFYKKNSRIFVTTEDKKLLKKFEKIFFEYFGFKVEFFGLESIYLSEDGKKKVLGMDNNYEIAEFYRNKTGTPVLLIMKDENRYYLLPFEGMEKSGRVKMFGASISYVNQGKSLDEIFEEWLFESISNKFFWQYILSGEKYPEVTAHSYSYPECKEPYKTMVKQILKMPGWYPVSEKDLPVLLPEIKKFEDILPDGSGKGPLEKHESFWKVKCPVCGGNAKRETDVSDPFVDSCWYFLRYPCTDLKDKPFDFATLPIIEAKSKITENVEKILSELEGVLKKAREENLKVWVSGSIALTFLNGGFYKEIKDIDLVCFDKDLKKITEMLKSIGYSESQKEKTNRNVEMVKGWVEVDIWSRNEALDKPFSKEDLNESWMGHIGNLSFNILSPKTMFEIHKKLLDSPYRTHKRENDKKAFDILLAQKTRTHTWLPVNMYIGGKEHTVLHLLYARFITMVLNDLSLIAFQEPFSTFFGHGLLIKDGAKMSKSRGNVINPDEYIEKFGADTVRLYLRFLGRFEIGGDWRDTGIKGMYRFVKRVWNYFNDENLETHGCGVSDLSMVDKTIKFVEEDIERLSFNTAVARIMEYCNWYDENFGDFTREQRKKVLEVLLLVLAPFAPFITEELWERLEHKSSIHLERWPKYDPANIIEKVVEIPVQINGKLRGTIKVERGSKREDVERIAISDEKIARYISESPKKVIFVQDRLINFVL